jgi:hypothetical protein
MGSVLVDMAHSMIESGALKKPEDSKAKMAEQKV